MVLTVDLDSGRSLRCHRIRCSSHLLCVCWSYSEVMGSKYEISFF